MNLINTEKGVVLILVLVITSVMTLLVLKLSETLIYHSKLAYAFNQQGWLSLNYDKAESVLKQELREALSWQRLTERANSKLFLSNEGKVDFTTLPRCKRLPDNHWLMLISTVNEYAYLQLLGPMEGNNESAYLMFILIHCFLPDSVDLGIKSIAVYKYTTTDQISREYKTVSLLNKELL